MCFTDLSAFLYCRNSWCGRGCDCHQDCGAVQKEPGADSRVGGGKNQSEAAGQSCPGAGAGSEGPWSFSCLQRGLPGPWSTPPEREPHVDALGPSEGLVGQCLQRVPQSLSCPERGGKCV